MFYKAILFSKMSISRIYPPPQEWVHNQRFYLGIYLMFDFVTKKLDVMKILDEPATNDAAAI